MATPSKVNILITGTPGTGKSTLCDLVASASGFEHVDTGKLVREKGLHTGFDEEYQAYSLDEDKLLDELEERMVQGGVVLEAHSCDYFPERWFSLVVVLRTSNTTLFDRLTQRGYNEKKLQENVECEIMQVIADEARASYKPEIILELPNDTIEELERNSCTILNWIRSQPTQ